MLTSQSPVLTPSNLQEALHLRAENPDAMPLAGGTDVMVFIESGSINPPAFLDLWSLRELATIQTHDDGSVSIGALCTHAEIIAHHGAQTAAPMLIEACRTVGAQQIQNRGTLAGNIANGSPAGDTLPVLLALDAEIEVESRDRGSRRIRMASVYTGYRTLAMEPDELITWVHLPPRHPKDRTHFRKVGTRQAQAISKVILAVRLRVEAGVVSEARVAVGSVGPCPMRSPAVESALVGQSVDPNMADRLSRDITPIDDVRSTAAYRLSVSKRVLRSCLNGMKD
jgi:xanthine dehydrogenase small subunit